jgi:dTDP-glucose 4,6-dehydratase
MIILKKILVTGGAGFIGSNFIRYLLNEHEDIQIINLDILTYAGSITNLADIMDDKRHKFIHGSINDERLLANLFRNNIDYIVNFAAESHVDRSIQDSLIFTKTNILGTHVLLEVARKHGIKKFIQVSTDEVYGSLGKEGFFSEISPLSPSNPYSASKASADLICLSYYKTYKLPILITRCCNNYGPYQFPEKLIPLMAIKAIKGEKLPVYGNGENIREWIHVIDHCRAIDTIMNYGKTGEIYNISTRQNEMNINIVKKILQLLSKTEDLIQFVEDRPGHDFRYALDNTKITKELGWKPIYDLESGLKETAMWYKENEKWWEKLIL